MGKKIDLQEFSRKGGLKTVELHGSEHMAKIARIGRRKVTKAQYSLMGKASAHAREVKKQAFIRSNIIDESPIGKFSRLLTG